MQQRVVLEAHGWGMGKQKTQNRKTSRRFFVSLSLPNETQLLEYWQAECVCPQQRSARVPKTCCMQHCEGTEKLSLTYVGCRLFVYKSCRISSLRNPRKPATKWSRSTCTKGSRVRPTSRAYSNADPGHVRPTGAAVAVAAEDLFFV